MNEEKFLAFYAVQQSVAYNMYDPRARILANEMNDLQITKSEWVEIMKNYTTLKSKYIK
jgi:hypothetical protein